MAQEKHPSEGRKSDSGSREEKPNSADFQGVDLGASKGADLQVSAAAPAAFASLTGFLNPGEETVQKPVVDDEAPETARAPAPVQDIETSPRTTDLSGSSAPQAISVAAPNAPNLSSDIASGAPTPPISGPALPEAPLRAPAASDTPSEPSMQTAPKAQTAPAGSEATAATTVTSDEDMRQVEAFRTLSSQLAEDSADGTSVIVLPDVGQYGDQISYRFTDVDGNPISPDGFEIVGNVVQVASGGTLDFELAETRVVYVTATTPAGTSSPWPITLTVSDVAEMIQLEGNGEVFVDTGVAESRITGGLGNDTITGHSDGAVLDGAAGDDNLTGMAGDDALTGGAGNDALDGGAGDDLALYSGNWSDYRITEADGVYTVTDLRPDSPEGTDRLTGIETLVFADGALSVADALNDAPELTATSGVVSESDVGAAVGPVAARDADAGDSVTFSVDDTRFEVVDGQLKLRDGVTLDYEADGPAIVVTVTVTDSHGATDTQVVDVTVGDLSEVIQLSDAGEDFADDGVAETRVAGGAGNDTITAHADGGVLVGGAGDDDLIGGSGDDALRGGTGDDAIDGGTGNDVATWAGDLLDFAVAYDSDTAIFTITDLNANDGDAGVDTVSGVETFVFNGATYTAAEMETEADRQANTAPDAPIVASGGSVEEDSAAGTVVAVLTAADVDEDALSYQITDADGLPVIDDTFEIIGAEVRVREGADIDFETAGSHGLYVTASDQFETSAPQFVALTVSDVAETIQLSDGGNSFVDRGVAETSITGGAGGDTITGHSDGATLDGASGDDDLTGGSGDDVLTGGTGNDAIDGADGANDAAVWAGGLEDFSIDYDRTSESFTVTDNNTSDGFDEGTDTVTGVESFAFDGVTYTASEMIAEAARQANTGPGSPSIASGGSIAENSASGTVVAVLTATDTDGDSLSFAITDADGNAVTDSNFEVVGNELRVRAGADLDYETAGFHSLFVTASDQFETSAPQALTVTVSDVAEDIMLDDGGANFTEAGVTETSVTGGTGDDAIVGSSTVDNLSGGSGNDTLSSDRGNDVLSGGDGDDVIDGGDGRDTLYGGAGNDTIEAGEELNQGDDDVIFGGDGDDVITSVETASNSNDSFYGEDGNDSIFSQGGGDTLSGGAGDDTLSGGTGDDLIDGGGDRDTAVWQGDLAEFGVSFDSGTQTFTITYLNAGDADEGQDTVTGVETFVFNGVTYTAAEIETEADRQANSGPGAASVASGGSVDENSVAGMLVARLTATDADGDTLSYTLTDADGNPVIDSNFEIVGNEVRVRDGAHLDFEAASSHGLFVTASDAFETSEPQAITVTVNDAAEVIQLGDGGESFTETGVIETSVTGGAGNDTIDGSGGADNLSGGFGNDRLDGGAGNDTLDAGRGNDLIFGSDGNDSIDASDGFDTVYGGNDSDTIDGGGGDDALYGGAASDTLTGAIGDDFIDGGDDSDTAVWQGNLADFSVVYDADSATFTVTDLNSADGDEGVDTVTGVETFRFNGTDYTLDDMITEAARQSNEAPTQVFFTSGGSVDETVADGGSIAAAYDPSGATVATLATSDADSGDSHTYTLVDDASDKFEIVGNEVRVKAGQTVDYETDTSFDLTIRTTDQFGETHDEVLTLNVIDFEGDYTAMDGGETVTGTSEEDTITGGGGADVLFGGGDDDVLSAGGGNDTLMGDSGFNFVVNGSFEDVAAADIDSVRALASEVSGWSDANGTNFEMHVDGYAGTSASDGDYWLDMAENQARMDISQTVDGLEDGQAYQLSFEAGQTHRSLPGEMEVFFGGELIATISGSIEDQMDTYDFDLVGGSGDGSNELRFVEVGSNDRVGTALDNVRIVAAGDDSLSGGSGDDILNGGAGSDTLDGGIGDDVLKGGAGNDTAVFSGHIGDYDISFDSTTQRFTITDLTGPDGIDVVTGVEIFDFNGTTYTAAEVEAASYMPAEDTTPDADNPDFDSGYAEPATYEGTDGNDSQWAGSSNDVMYGRGSTDDLGGGAGDDTIYGGSGGDRLYGQDGEDAVYGGSGADSIFGAAGNDVLYGDADNDSLHGGDGLDTMFGGTGHDTLYGEAGADEIYGGAGNDYIDGGSENDTIDGGDGDDLMYGQTGDDYLTGGAGNDTFDGGEGADTIYGGLGDDLMRGQGGSDVFTVTALEGSDTIDGGAGWTDVIELVGLSGDVFVADDKVLGEGWTMVLENGHAVTEQTLDSLELTADAVGVITFDDGGTIDFSGIERITF